MMYDHLMIRHKKNCVLPFSVAKKLGMAEQNFYFLIFIS